MIEVELDKGKGRATVILYEKNSLYTLEVHSFTEQCAKNDSTRVIKITHVPFRGKDWKSMYAALVGMLNTLGVRSATFISFGTSTVLTQALAHNDLKRIRMLIMVDPATRAHPTTMMKIADKIEEYLPMGLPLRLPSEDFDGRSLLQRIRCPVLVVASKNGGERMQEINLITEKLPTSWLKDISAQESFPDALYGEVQAFQEVPAKCPQ